MSRFQEMVNHIPEDSTVVVVGAKEEQLSSFRNFSSGRRVEALMQIPKNLSELIHGNYLNSAETEEDRNIYIPQAHRFSYCELEFSAQVIAWENDLIEFRTPSRLANYGLIRIASRERGHEGVYGKVLNVRIADENENLVICQLSSPSQDVIDRLTKKKKRRLAVKKS